MFSADLHETIDRIFALEHEVAAPQTGEEAILFASLTQQKLVRRAFYLANSQAFRDSYLADLEAYTKVEKDYLSIAVEMLSRPIDNPEVNELASLAMRGVEGLQEHYPLLMRSLPPIREADARPPQRALETLLRISILGYSPATRQALRSSFLALMEAGTSPAKRQLECLARLQGYSSPEVAELKLSEALLDASYANEEEFLCGGEC